MNKPTLIYDGDCNFCRRWINRWQSLTGAQIDYAPFQFVADRFPQISQEDFRKSVQFVELDGQIYSGAEAVFRTLAYTKGRRWLIGCYRNLPGFRLITEWFYNLVARNRILFSQLTRLLWGDDLSPPTYYKSSAAFIRILGIAYLVAFVSLWSQLTGLIGSSGILPASEFLTSIRAETGIERYWFVPTIFWLRAGDGILELACALGVLLSLFLIAGIASSPICLSLWILYLSLVTVGDDFLEFQWDNLLLEIGFLIIFLTPPKLWNKFSPQTPPSSMVLWLLRWLLFRLMFSSGMVKLVSGDPTWRNLTALQFHYETQPLPTWIGWFFHQLPLGFQKMSAVTMFGIELIIPFLFFMPKRIRYFGCGATLFLQILILLTGNYCFFNLLTIGLCILLLDDKFWSQKALEPEPARPARWPQWIIASIAAIVLTVTGMQVSHLFWRRPAWPLPAVLLYRLVAPFRSMNSYGLFAVMTTKRPEIIIEGSHDGKTWSAYEFKWKPGDLKRRPQFVEPHQPRLDWQMWFAALGSYKHNPWFISLMRRLLEGSSDVLNLLAKNPFPDKPPKYVRALLYEYRFTDRETLRTTGNWWRRELKGLYCPVISLSRS